jgi:hypothetical protein
MKVDRFGKFGIEFPACLANLHRTELEPLVRDLEKGLENPSIP